MNIVHSFERVSKVSNSFLNFFFILLFVTLMTNAAFAQRSSRHTDDRNESDDFLSKVYVGAYINSPFIGGTTNGSVFALGLQPFAAYKWNEYFSTGLSLRYDFAYLWSPGFSTSLSDFSATTFTRATIANRVILQVEGGYFSKEQIQTATDTERFNFPVVFAGVGYTNGFYELLITYELLGQLFLYQNPFEYKIGFVKHF